MASIADPTTRAAALASLMLAIDYTPNDQGPELSTWLFLGSLALAAAGVLATLRWSVSGYRPPAPRDDLLPEDLLWDEHGVHRNHDLGNRWRSTDDPYAIWHLWFLPDLGVLVGMRMAAMAHPASMRPGLGRSPGRTGIGLTFEEDGRQIPWDAGPGHRRAVTGMKVLATDFDCPHHDVWATLRPLPDGIDQLCGGTGFDVDAPASPGDVASNDG